MKTEKYVQSNAINHGFVKHINLKRNSVKHNIQFVAAQDE